MTDNQAKIGEIKIEKPEPEKYAELRKKKENRAIGLYATVFVVGLILVFLTEYAFPRMETSPSESLTKTMTLLRLGGRFCVGFGIASTGFLATLKMVEHDVNKQDKQKDDEYWKQRRKEADDK